MKALESMDGPTLRDGFTLLEVLVSTVVLMLLLVLVAQIVGVTGDAIGRTRSKMAAAGEARLFLDRLGADLAVRVTRSDVPVEFINAAGNDTLRFYAEADGYGGDRGVSLVGYRVQESSSDRYFQVERGATGSNWDGNPLGAGSLPTTNDADYEVLSDGIFRMEICYLKKSDGSLTNVRPALVGDIAALVVGVAVIAKESRAKLSDAQIKELADALPDPADGDAPVIGWRNALEQTGFASGVPREAVKAVECYQRAYPLP
jgi:type II secretory pathway pseudopilin PulG